MTGLRTEVIRHHVVVNAPIERAFALFIDRFGDFTTRVHNLLSVPVAETVFEPQAGGHIEDRGVDGSVCRWARVLEYAPPERVIFTWDVDPNGQLETDPTKTSEVEVNFTAETADRTRVDLEHRHLDRHDQGEHTAAGDTDADSGWPLYLQRYSGKQVMCTRLRGHGPTVVLETHGGGDGTTGIYGLDEQLAKFATVLAYDRPGTGRSDGRPVPMLPRWPMTSTR